MYIDVKGIPDQTGEIKAAQRLYSLGCDLAETLRRLFPRGIVHHSPGALDHALGLVVEVPSGFKCAVQRGALSAQPGWPDIEMVLDGETYYFYVNPQGRALDDAQQSVMTRLLQNEAMVAAVWGGQDLLSTLAAWELIE